MRQKAQAFTTDTKQLEYRVPLWTAVHRRCRQRAPQQRRVCILETAGALEVRHLFSLGYRSRHIYACNWLKGQLGWLNIRVGRWGRPHVHTIAGDILLAVVKHGPFDVVSYDSCSILSNETAARIRALRGCMRAGSVLTATVIDGRDAWGQERRTKAFLATLGGGGAEVFRYCNGGHALLWGITTI